MPILTDEVLVAAARTRSQPLIDRARSRTHTLPARFRSQSAHLTCPATVWKYVEAAATRSAADLVMLDLEDSIPRGDLAALHAGRANVVRALTTLDWGDRLRFFRPRGLDLDPGHEDLVAVVSLAGGHLDGVVLPKVDDAGEVASVDATLTALETRLGIEHGAIGIEVLIESVQAERAVFEIAEASPRVRGLVFGAFDYWGSLDVPLVPYRFDHPLIEQARARIVKAAASVGVPAIAEMTLEFPTREKSPEQQAHALATCRRDALHARDTGFRGKWTGIPAQTAIVREVFAPDDSAVMHSVNAVRAFLQAERAGRGAVMIDGEMADRATDRVHRAVLRAARATGRLDEAIARELGL